MPRRNRLRTFTLWTGTTLSLLIVAAFVVSGCWSIQIPTPFGSTVEVIGGALAIDLDGPAEWVVYRRMTATSIDVALPFYHWDRWNWWYLNLGVYLGIPLYAVIAAVAIPTLLVWRFGRKPVKPGHCRCGYNLTGLTEPRCPECGQPFEAKGDTP